MGCAVFGCAAFVIGRKQENCRFYYAKERKRFLHNRKRGAVHSPAETEPHYSNK